MERALRIDVMHGRWRSAGRQGVSTPVSIALGRPRLQVDRRQLEHVARRGVSVRAGAQALGISPSSYLRLIRNGGDEAAVGME